MITLVDRNFNFGAFKDVKAIKILLDAVKVGRGGRDTEKSSDKELCLQLFVFVPSIEMIYGAQDFIKT